MAFWWTVEVSIQLPHPTPPPPPPHAPPLSQLFLMPILQCEKGLRIPKAPVVKPPFT